MQLLVYSKQLKYSHCSPVWMVVFMLAALLVGGCAEDGLIRGPVSTPRVLAATTDALLAVNPVGGYGGTYVSVTGSGWPAGSVITVMIADERGHSGILVAAGAAQDGTFSTGFLYPLADRWLTPGTHAIIAQTSSGQIQAQAPFEVIPPTDVEAPTPVPTDTSTPTALPPTATATATATFVPPTTTVTPTATPVPPTATPVPTATALPPTATTVAGAAAATVVVDESPIQAALMPVEVEKEKGLFQVVAQDASGNPATVQAFIETRRLDEDQEIKLKRHNKKIHIKWNANKLEIQAPNPQAVLRQLRQLNGIPVIDGQLIEFELTDNGEHEIEMEEGTLKVKAPVFALTVAALNDGKLTDAVTVVPQFAEVTASDPGGDDGDDGGDDEREDERDDERDDDDDEDEGGQNRGKGNRGKAGDD